METGYYNTHYENVRNSVYFAIPVPGLKKAGIRFHLYTLLAMTINVTVFCLFTIAILQTKIITRICTDFIATLTVLYGSVICIFLSKIAKRFKDLLKDFDDIMFSCMNDPLDPEKTFYSRMLSDYKYVGLYAKISVPAIAVGAVVYFGTNIIRGLGYLGFDGEKVISVDIWLPNTHESPTFEIAQSLSMMGIYFSASQKQSVECFILSLLILLCSYLDHLQETMNNVFGSYFPENLNQPDSNIVHIIDNRISNQNYIPKTNQYDINLKGWIKIHQKTLRLSRQLIDLLSPLLAFYLVNITTLVAVIIFTISLGEINFNESSTLFNYTVTNGTSLFLMCFYGSKLTEKSQEVSQPAYWKCFLQNGAISKKTYNTLTVIFQRTVKPLIVSPFRSSSFELSNSSFVSFGWSIVSFYMAIKKIKEVGAA